MTKRTLHVAVATFFLFLGSTTGSMPQDSKDLLLVGATVIDGTGGKAINDGWIRVEQGRIHSIGQREPPAADGAEVLRLQGKTVLPGLADMHVHLRNLQTARWMLKALLAHGVTAVRETGNNLGDIAAIRRWTTQEAAVPRYYAANSPLQGSQENLQFMKPGGEVERAVENYAAFGVDFLKTYNFLSSMGLRQAVRVAEKHDIPVIGHTPVSGSSVSAFEAGLMDMQHLRLRPYEVLDDLETIAKYPVDEPLMERTGFWAHVTRDGRNIQQTLDLWAQHKDRIYVTPTLVAQEAVASSYDYPDPRSKFENKPGAEFVSERVLSSWQESSPPSDRWGELNEEELAEARQSLDGMAIFLGMAHERGIQVLSGTDTPVPWVVPGVSLHDELAHFVEKSGMTPEEAIHTSTGRPAGVLGTPNRGTIEAGQVADLVIVDGNVARDIRSSRNVEQVILEGRRYTRAELMEQVRSWAAQDTVEAEE